MDPSAGPDPAERARRREPPGNELPVVLPWAAVLARNDELAVALVGAWVYRNGLALAVTMRSRHSNTPNLGAALHTGLDVYQSDDGASRPAKRDQLLLGVEYADGRHTSTVSPEPLARGQPPRPAFVGEYTPDHEPLLAPGGGSGAGGRHDAQFFLSPLPPPGGLSVYCAWPLQGVPETRTLFNTESLPAAVQSVQVLWPDEPEPDEITEW